MSDLSPSLSTTVSYNVQTVESFYSEYFYLKIGGATGEFGALGSGEIHPISAVRQEFKVQLSWMVPGGMKINGSLRWQWFEAYQPAGLFAKVCTGSYGISTSRGF